MQLYAILCKFGRICATRNALMQLETILCELGRICATRNALMLLKTILCEFGRRCAAGNASDRWLDLLMPGSLAESLEIFGVSFPAETSYSIRYSILSSF